jgi:uncharacterized protein
MNMKPHVSAITLGARDIERTKMFYGEGLAWPLLWERAGHSVGFSLGDGSSVLDLFQWNALADDAGVAPNGSGFPGFAFSYIVSSEGPRERVDEVLAEAQRGGGTIVRPGQAAQWGGYFGYFADPDGHLWKVVKGYQKRPNDAE